MEAMEEQKELLLERVYYENCPGCKLDQKKYASVGIPYNNFCCVWLLTFTAELLITSAFPYLYFMIRDLHVAKSVEDIGFYAGFVALGNGKVLISGGFRSMGTVGWSLSKPAGIRCLQAIDSGDGFHLLTYANALTNSGLRCNCIVEDFCSKHHSRNLWSSHVFYRHFPDSRASNNFPLHFRLPKKAPHLSGLAGKSPTCASATAHSYRYSSTGASCSC